MSVSWRRDRARRIIRKANTDDWLAIARACSVTCACTQIVRGRHVTVIPCNEHYPALWARFEQDMAT